MSRLTNVFVALCACVLCAIVPSRTFAQVEGPDLDMAQPPGTDLTSSATPDVSPTVEAPGARPVWRDRPEAEDLRRHFPRDALRAGIAGRVVLECLVRNDGSLLCVVVVEDPPEHRFGEAALKIAENYRAATYLQDGSPAQGARVRLPITFAVAP